MKRDIQMRRLQTLMNKYTFHWSFREEHTKFSKSLSHEKHLIEQQKDGLEHLPKCYQDRVNEQIEMYNLKKELGITDNAFEHTWAVKSVIRSKAHSSYHKMPKNERKDNKTFINYGGVNSNRNKIRYPKKNRKTAWKRFYKLFPHLNPENNKNK